MLSRIGQALSHSPDGFSLAPGSMLLRLRRASLGMLCLVGAVGLGLIAFIAQLDWPDVLSGPLPGGAAKVGRVDDAVGLTAASPPRAAATVSSGRPARRVTTGTAHGGRIPASAAGRAGLGHSRDLAGAPSQPSPGVAQPVAPAPTGPAEVGAESAPAASTVPVAAAGGSSKGSAKATADGGKAAAAVTASKSKGQKSSAKSSAPATSSPGNSAAAKARNDESAAGKPAAPAPAPEAKPSSPAGPASAKEAADAANSQ